MRFPPLCFPWPVALAIIDPGNGCELEFLLLHFVHLTNEALRRELGTKGPWRMFQEKALKPIAFCLSSVQVKNDRGCEQSHKRAVWVLASRLARNRFSSSQTWRDRVVSALFETCVKGMRHEQHLSKGSAQIHVNLTREGRTRLWLGMLHIPGFVATCPHRLTP